MKNMDGCLINEDSTLARESDLHFAVDNVEKVYGYVDEKNLEKQDDFNEDLQHEQQSSPSLHADADFRYEISESLPQKPYPVPTESDNDHVIETKFVHDQERTQSPFEDNYHYRGEMDELHGSNFLNPSSQSKSQTFHNEMGTEDSAHSQESPPLTKNANQGAGEESDSDMGRPTFAPHAIRGKSIYWDRSQYESNKSSIHEGQMSISPEGFPSPHHAPNNHEYLPSYQGSQDLSYAPRSHRQNISSRELLKGVSPDNLSPVRQTSASTQSIRKRSQQKDNSALKHKSESPRYHHSPPRSHRSPPNYRRRYRSGLRSPIRHRDSYGYQRDYCDRSRSRFPYSSAHHRSTRGRHSPRRRSPFPEYHSHRGSPRRKAWSPPPNRKTGLGKPGRNLFVAGFSFTTREKDLERKFSRYGRVRDVRIVRDKRSGDSRGFGFLTLERDEDADAAIRALDETEWNGRIILVEKSKS